MPKPKEGKVFVCGPPPLVASICGPKNEDKSQGAVEGVLKAMGYGSEDVFKFQWYKQNIFLEVFKLTVKQNLAITFTRKANRITFQLRGIKEDGKQGRREYEEYNKPERRLSWLHGLP